MSTLTAQEPRPLADDIVADDELYEVIDGKRVRTPPMAVYSVWVASQLHVYLANFARSHVLGRAIVESLFHLPAPINRDRRPDVACVSYQRWAKARPVPISDPWDVVPNLATEVVSPSDKAQELDDKIAEYLRVGVEIVWVVWPLQSKIHVHTSSKDIVGLTRAGVLEGGNVLPGFRLPLAELFADATEPVSTNGAGEAH